ncbi:hypothetical protein CWI39_0546p0010 [Hamiltosporidium magnivora]|uniref:Uncharacterized protein n=1 Tax=Hamiltosporidium magnivora TaxID=148818 RepID=A0A4Q9LF98_9MICR|nr:hypothetical protein CWI39_0546p0010 [Hamiltosporidium magnivora]
MSKLLCVTLFFILKITKGTNEANSECLRNESLQRMINEAIDDNQDFTKDRDTIDIKDVATFEMIDSDTTSFTSTSNEENFVNVLNNIENTKAFFGKNKCGGFFIPGLGESSINSFHIFIVQIENILKACGASQKLFTLVLKFADNHCQDFESTISMLNDNLKMILDKF